MSGGYTGNGRRPIALLQPQFTEMPTVNGDPIVESGSNADGEWTRWADGTQECRGATFDTTGVSFVAHGSGFRTDSNIIWTFPMPFIAKPAFNPAGDSPNTWNSPAGATSTLEGQARQFSLVSVAVSASGLMSAHGKWK